MTSIAADARPGPVRKTKKSCRRDPADLCGEKRLRILDRATIAFLTRGFEGTNLEDVAIAAGVGKVTIYNYFADKSDLFENVLLKAVQETGRPLRDILNKDAPFEDVLIEFSVCYIQRMMRPVAGNRCFYDIARVLIGATHQHPHLTQSCVDIFSRDLRQPLIDFLERRAAIGEFVPQQSCEFLAAHFIQALFFTNAVAMDRNNAPKPEMLPSHARQKVSLFLYGCRGRPN